MVLEELTGVDKSLVFDGNGLKKYKCQCRKKRLNYTFIIRIPTCNNPCQKNVYVLLGLIILGLNCVSSLFPHSLPLLCFNNTKHFFLKITTTLTAAPVNQGLICHLLKDFYKLYYQHSLKVRQLLKSKENLHKRSVFFFPTVMFWPVKSHKGSLAAMSGDPLWLAMFQARH